MAEINTKGKESKWKEDCGEWIIGKDMVVLALSFVSNTAMFSENK